MPRKILLIDDSPSLRATVKLLLKAPEVEFVEARDGVEGLAIAGHTELELVIADFNLPSLELDGLEFVRRLREHPQERARGIPVILLTANKEPAIRQQAEAAGALFADKPVSRAQLTARIEAVLGHARGRKP